jgi:hypothetical protein
MEQFGLVFNTSESGKVFAMVDQVLAEKREVYRERSKTFLATKENATQYYYDFIVNRYQKNSKTRPNLQSGTLQPETLQP